MTIEDLFLYIVFIALGFLVVCAWLLTASRARIRRLEQHLGIDPDTNIDTAPPGHPINTLRLPLIWARQHADRNGADPLLRRWLGVFAVACWAALAMVALVLVFGLALAVAGIVPV